MPGKGHAFQITREWQDRVRQRLVEKDISQNELARQVKMRPSSLSAALKPGAIQTTKMPAINKFLGLEPPIGEPSAIVQEGARYLMQMDDVERGRWVERLRQAAEIRKRSRG